MDHKVGFFCKSFRDDFAPLRQLLDSFERHNRSKLTLTLSLPHADITRFTSAFGANPSCVQVVADESYAGADLRRLDGWRGQQVCKLLSWKTVEAEHYVVLDSDCYFIRDVPAADLVPCDGRKFMAYASYIRTVMTPENRDLLRYLRGELPSASDWLPQAPQAPVDRLSEFVGYKELPQDNPSAMQRTGIPTQAFGVTRWLYCQPGQIFSAGLLNRLCELFARHAMTAGDAILVSPWEYDWYGAFAATHGFGETEFRISPFVHFQDAASIDVARQEGFTEESLRERFSYVQMAARHLSNLRF